MGYVYEIVNGNFTGDVTDSERRLLKHGTKVKVRHRDSEGYFIGEIAIDSSNAPHFVSGRAVVSINRNFHRYFTIFPR